MLAFEGRPFQVPVPLLSLQCVLRSILFSNGVCFSFWQICWIPSVCGVRCVLVGRKFEWLWGLQWLLRDLGLFYGLQSNGCRWSYLKPPRLAGLHGPHLLLMLLPHTPLQLKLLLPGHRQVGDTFPMACRTYPKEEGLRMCP